ncbi:phosphate acyltransferase PlsX ['Camptotheca acuminata' phytoplasma]|uniref:phosphate acyltransferase PlsX n=1 Tax='Camptotheca acuminata' phytoplasma TaxID=3239192 RepID=UPI00351A13CA
MIKLAVDAMGGDHGPAITTKAVFRALREEKNLSINLYGDRKQIEQIIQKNSLSKAYNSLQQRLTIVHTPLFLKMDIENTREELRDHPENSMFLALQAAKNNEVDGTVSAGPTQALVLSSFLIIRTTSFAKRIALAPIFNSINDKKIILIDAGANIEIEPENLLNFAIYATIAFQELFQIKNPIIKLLNIGIEKNKGRNFEKKLYNLLEKDIRINFQGNEESKNVLATDADILLSDAFTSNMVLKSYEGAIQNSFQIVKNVLTENWLKKIITKIFFANKMKKIKKKLDAKEMGGAMLLGLNKIVIKAHGDSDEYAFYKAILQAKILIEQNFINKVYKNFTLSKGINDEL